MNEQTDVVIVGGGLAGLTAAVVLARARCRVSLLEKAGHIGGRAITTNKQGFAFNLGPHALYSRGAARRIFDELGVPWRGRRPALSGGYALANGQRATLPSGAVSLLTTGMFNLWERLEAAQWLGRLARIDAAKAQHLSVREWLQREIEHAAVRDLVQALLRLATYANDPARQSAGAALGQLQLALSSSVQYLDGGWQTLVDGLRAAATQAGAQVFTGARAQAVIADQQQVRGLQLADGSVLAASSVLLAVAPAEAAALTSKVLDSGTRTPWQQAIPVRAACLDVALTHLPQPHAIFALGVDAPLYVSVHSATAQLAPAGGALIHVAKYLPGDESADAHAVEAELEQTLEQLQPGWRAAVVERRFLPSLTVTNALVTAEQGGVAGRPSVAVPNVNGLWLAGDWVGGEGQLADASVASAHAAAHAILNQHRER